MSESSFFQATNPIPGSAGWWEEKYRAGRPPWDSGVVPPELIGLVESGQLQPPGVTLDLGCGTGINVNYLAGLGFAAYGVDLAGLALEQARRKARPTGPLIFARAM